MVNADYLIWKLASPCAGEPINSVRRVRQLSFASMYPSLVADTIAYQHTLPLTHTHNSHNSQYSQYSQHSQHSTFTILTIIILIAYSTGDCETMENMAIDEEDEGEIVEEEDQDEDEEEEDEVYEGNGQYEDDGSDVDDLFVS